VRVVRRFKYIEDESGEFGFMPTWIKGADPFQRVGHDMLEHFLVPQCNAAEAELMALGAMLVIRVDGNANRYMSPEQSLAMVIESAMTDWVCDDHDDPRPLATRPLRDQDWAERVIGLAVPNAFAGVARNFSDDPPFDNTLQPVVMSWLRAGVRAAHRRYRRANTDLYTIGDYVIKKLNDFSQKLPYNDVLQGGDEVIITADVDACEFFATVRGRRI
jgi:hypothetical protein